MRLARYLSQAGVASRRKSETLIRDGVVSVNGKVIRDVATNVDPDNDRIKVDGKGVVLEDLFYVVLNKPKGCLSAVSDPDDRPTVMDYLPKIKASVKPVGRLDFNSEGVLLLTNDGELNAALLSPRKHVEKTYHVKIYGKITDRAIALMRKGVKLDDGKVTRPAQVDRLKSASKHDWIVITITEGKNRQIHRMAEALGMQVTKIQRVAFATLSFHGLRVGDARELDSAELKDLRKLVGLKPNPRSDAKGKWSAKREMTDRMRRQRAQKSIEAELEAAGESPLKARTVAKAKTAKKWKTSKPASRRGSSSSQGRGAKAAGPKRGTRTATAPKRGTKAAAPKRGTKAAAPKRGTKAAAPKRGTKAAAPKRGTKAAAPKRAAKAPAGRRGSSRTTTTAGRKSAPKAAAGSRKAPAKRAPARPKKSPKGRR